MTVGDLIVELSALGLDAEMTLKIVTLASRYASRDGRDAKALAAARARRYRASKSGRNGEAKANDVASTVTQNVTLASRYASRDGRDASCNLSFLEEVKKEDLRERKKKATRLDSQSKLSDIDRQFARNQGMVDHLIDRHWAEFVDYWIGVPGQRGTKLDWSATWRNRVRQVTAKRQGQSPASKLGIT